MISWCNFSEMSVLAIMEGKSIIELEEKSHRPFNPMINSGAIATTSLVKGESFAEKFQNIKISKISNTR